MKKLFLDTNVVLDLLLDREPFNDDIAEIIEYSIEIKQILCISSTSVTNLNYIISRLENKKSANKKTDRILELVQVENVGESTVKKAIKSKFKDFEDGVQNFCAAETNHKIVITRNTKDYKESMLSILTPKEYLARRMSN